MEKNEGRKGGKKSQLMYETLQSCSRSNHKHYMAMSHTFQSFHRTLVWRLSTMMGMIFGKNKGGVKASGEGERGRFINIARYIINPFTEYCNREQLTVSLRWRLTSCEIQYLEFALQNCTCKNKTNKENKKWEKKKKKEYKRNHKRHREETHTGCVLSNADCSVHLGRRPGKLQKVWKPQTDHLLVNRETTKESKTEPKWKKIKRWTKSHMMILGLYASICYTHTMKVLRRNHL